MRITRCHVCSTADSTLVADAHDIRAELEFLWAHHDRRLRPGTPPERLTDRVAFSENPPVRVVQCNHCGFVYRNPIERDQELEDVYANSTLTGDDATLRALHESQRKSYRTQARRLIHALGRRGSGLEVGSYVGAFLSAARDVGLHAEGVDVNARVNRFTRSLGFAVHDGTIETIEPHRTYDTIAFWNCFDQLSSPFAAAVAAHRLMAPNGILAIRVPNGDFYARVRPLLHTRRAPIARALLAQNNLLGFPYRYGFTPASLAHLLQRAGFTPVHTEGDVLVPTSDSCTRPWAAAEEYLLKLFHRPLARRNMSLAPWFEFYARR